MHVKTLTPDKAPLQTAKTQLEQSINQPTDTTGMTTASLKCVQPKITSSASKVN
ncbi:hypothetical protein T9H88_11745 [Staphylococcus aureus]|nr:hypothetical protein T9H88_11745 [Staphylococcus aureus]